ncbi:MAG: nucleoside hydrolase [Ilumatobacteraceae bacterium]
MRTHSCKVLMTVALLAAAASCSNDDSDSDIASTERMQVVFDYSPTLSDAGALLYLASHPSVELLAVTLPGTGEADCEPGVQITRALLTVAGQADVPIGCGRNTPLVGERDWPDAWRGAANTLGEGLLPTVDAEPVVDAEQLLATTLRDATAPVTLVAVGPLTNLGVVLGDDPDLASRVERIVIMGGALDVPGNVENAPTAEWNLYVDPEATRRVIAAGPPVTFVALDATNYMAWTDRLLVRIDALDTSAADVVYQLANSTSLDGFYLWDELAAIVAVDQSVVTTESVSIRVDDDGALVRDPEGITVEIAVSAETSTARDQFVQGLNGGKAPPQVSLTAGELDYFVQVGGADSRFNIVINTAFGGLDESNPDTRGMATALFEGFFTGVDGLLVDLRDIDPPASLDGEHSEYIDSLAVFAASRDEVFAAVAVAEGAELFEMLESVLEDAGINQIFDRANAACQALVNYSFLRDGPRPCTQGT